MNRMSDMDALRGNVAEVIRIDNVTDGNRGFRRGDFTVRVKG